MMDTTSAFYRVYNINDALVRNDQAIAISAAALLHQVCKDDLNLFAQKITKCYKGADFIIIQGSPQLDTIKVIENAHRTGKVVLIEVDDLVDNTTQFIDDVTGKRARGKWLQRAAIWPHADGFITSTAYLARHYSNKFNKPAWVFENYIDAHDPRWSQKKTPNENPVIGYMGSYSHITDLRLIIPAIKEVLDSHPSAEFHIMGAIPKELLELKEPRIKDLGHDPDIRGYVKKIAHFDIGLIPLKNEPFNLAKSDLKFLEYSTLGIPSIISKIDTYKSAQGKALFARDRADDWAQAIFKLLDDRKKREKIAKTAQEYVLKNRAILDNSYKYIKILEQARLIKKPKPQGKIFVPRKGLIIPTC